MKHWLARHWVNGVWLLAFGLASSVWCVLAAERVGVTFDEPFYIKAGLTSWRTGSNKLLMKAGTMTLPVDVQTLPIHLWERMSGQRYFTEADLPLVLPIARHANLVFWWLLLAYAMRLGCRFGGDWGGRLATALAACDPNLLGHAALATTDIACVACFLVFVYHFWQGLGRDWPRRVFIPAICYALAIQSKVSGLIFGMDAMLVLGFIHLLHTGKLSSPAEPGWHHRLHHLWTASHQLRWDVAWTTVIALVLVFAYTGCDWSVEPTFIKWAERLPDGQLKSALVPISRHLAIFPNAGEGILNQVKHNFRGHDTFLMGRWYAHATAPYFPVALTMKLPIPVLALLLTIVLIHPRHFLSPVGAVALLLLALSPNYRVQIGIRFMFPMIVLTYVAMGAAVARGWADAQSDRWVPRWFVAFMIVALAGTSAWVWPHGLSYFNQLWGGPSAGADLLHESNYDWGQGLPELRDWCRENGEERIGVWYYGMDPGIEQAQFVNLRLHLVPHGGDANQVRAACLGNRYLAVSVGCFGLNPDITPGFRVPIEWVRGQTPVARTPCFLIYRMH